MFSNCKDIIKGDVKMFKTKSNYNLSLQEFNTILSKFLMETIEENSPHKWIYDEEPFINQYNGKLSYDYSGKVEPLSVLELKEFIDSLGNGEDSDIYESCLDELLENLYVGYWEASYISNRGKNWVSYKDVFERKFNDWKYENFDLYNEDGEELNEELEEKLDNSFCEFLKKTSHLIYSAKMIKELKKE